MCAEDSSLEMVVLLGKTHHDDSHTDLFWATTRALGYTAFTHILALGFSFFGTMRFLRLNNDLCKQQPRGIRATGGNWEVTAAQFRYYLHRA